jgi:hypothetical protein
LRSEQVANGVAADRPVTVNHDRDRTNPELSDGVTGTTEGQLPDRSASQLLTPPVPIDKSHVSVFPRQDPVFAVTVHEVQRTARLL